MLHDSKGNFWVGTASHGHNLFFPEKINSNPMHTIHPQKMEY